ncbi:hypothetical protein HMPREF9629_01439 [Peptoanaerobacter stomatis]|uniref:Uncharacterized protein n=1 Tax=Peptoanaerobacter stomatis TaxID=796937 RepID=G9WZ38_9FIRM|nr:hypothetical protein [Peptoanaerobacter stomatis]EHL16183.1 hypothetical protein HMPREF9629_01439 [Peptoanaerobacter stomatis]
MLNEFNEKQKEMELSEMNKKAEDVVEAAVKRTKINRALLICPNMSLINEQIDLMISICGIYGIDIEKNKLEILINKALSECNSEIIYKIYGIPMLINSIYVETSGIITLSMGKAFIEVCKKVKLFIEVCEKVNFGDIRESDIISSVGEKIMKERFKEEMKRNNMDCYIK